jgi:hypothetical protein
MMPNKIICQHCHKSHSNKYTPQFNTDWKIGMIFCTAYKSPTIIFRNEPLPHKCPFKSITKISALLNNHPKIEI